MTDAQLRAHELHLDRLMHAYERLLEAQGYDALLIYSGHPHYHFADDQTASFATYAHFLHWVPLPGHSHSWLLIRPADRPVLYFHAPADFWHLPPRVPDEAWTKHFDIRVTSESLPPELPACRLAMLGDIDPARVPAPGIDLNPPALVQALDELRVHKTDYEIECIAQANRLALAGHEAARRAFDDGASELDIQLAYLQASRQRESEVPYSNIVGLNSHAGVLHYQHYEMVAPTRHQSLLVDAGARFAGYAADITRTWAGPDADPEFLDLIAGLERMQCRLSEEVHAGVAFPALHRRMHECLGELLTSQGLIRCSAQAAVDTGITRAFCPHGLGHLLGLQVHDVAGRVSPSGKRLPAPASDPALRLTRDLEAGMVITLEPGLYFIPMLLDPLRDSAAGRDIDWQKIECLASHGGIRIEDNLAVTVDGYQNLTRVNEAC